jgi:hypothetical protein
MIKRKVFKAFSIMICRLTIPGPYRARTSANNRGFANRYPACFFLPRTNARWVSQPVSESFIVEQDNKNKSSLQACYESPCQGQHLRCAGGSFPIKRFSWVSPDVMQAAVSADGRSVCVSIRRLKLLVQPLDRIGGSSDVVIPPREFPPHFLAAPVRCRATS